MRDTGRGPILALLAAALFGLSAPLAKLLLAHASPQLLAGLLYLGSGTGLGILWLIRGRSNREAQLSGKDLPWLAGAITFGGALGPVLLMAGLARTPASSASLLLNLEGVFTALIAWFVFRENFDRRIALGMLAIVAGGVLLSWEGRVEWGGLAGPLLIAGATLCWAVDNNFTQKVSGRDPVQIAMLKGLAAASLLVFREQPSARFVAAAALMALGVWLHMSERHEHEHTHKPMEHEHMHVHDEHHQHAHTAEDPPGEPHSHLHRHEPLTHTHVHYPDIHHRHAHD